MDETLVLFAPLANSRPRICGDDPGLTIDTLSWQTPDIRGKTSRKEQGPGTVHIKAHRADPRHNEHRATQMEVRMMKKIAIYCQDTGDPEDTADIQWQTLHLATQDQDVQIVRNYLDYRNFALQRLMGDVAGETPPFE